MSTNGVPRCVSGVVERRRLVHDSHTMVSTDPEAMDHDVLPTEDELLLELMDLVQLALPACLTSFTVQFVANDDGKRPALTDVNGTTAADARARPDLGHDDNRVLDAINALLNDLADATERRAGVRVQRGRITATTGADRSRVVELVDDAAVGADEDATRASEREARVVMSRRFDASELRWLFFTSALFATLADTEAREQQQRTHIDAELQRYRRFDIDMAKCTITFSGAREPDTELAPLTLAMALLGSHSEKTQRFLWGWANDSVGNNVAARVDGVRMISTAEGLRAFTEASFGCPERFAERLARHAAVKLAARGIYRAPFAGADTKGFMYLALFDATS